MTHAYLSDSWFEELEKIAAEVGDLQLPDMMKDFKLNLEVTEGPEGKIEAHIDGGIFKKGLIDGAPTKVIVPYDISRKMFIERDQAAGMQAFMSGQIKVEGDMGKLMSMQSAGGPTAPQQELEKRIRAMTEGAS